LRGCRERTGQRRHPGARRRAVPRRGDRERARADAPIECIVVDDGSTDGSAELARRFDGVQVLRSGGRGTAAARNTGARAARGELLAFLDADDRWLPHRIAVMHAAMRGGDARWSLCASRVVGERSPMGSVLRLRPMAPRIEDLLAWTGTVVPLGSNLLIERTLFDALGGFNAEIRHVEDWELLVRLAERDRFVYIDEPLVEYRWHAANKTRDVAGTERNLRRVYEQVLARDRSLSRRRAYAGLHRFLAAAYGRLGHRVRGAGHTLISALLDPVTAARYLGRRDA
jgi:glycosyltransferase involved in cell wall biosynthesis